jgi:hypothetical protein
MSPKFAAESYRAVTGEFGDADTGTSPGAPSTRLAPGRSAQLIFALSVFAS